MLPYIKSHFHPDMIIANAENAASGRGITAKIANELFELGIHGITMGNHTWDNKDIFDFIDQEKRMVRPANFPEGTPGSGHTIIKVGKKQLAIINLQGRTFLPPLQCPFETADGLLKELSSLQIPILVDFHAEATAEKIAMGWFLDGRASFVIGTHTHVQTNDARILPMGTGYMTDAGMVGPRDGVLGMQKEAVLQKFITQLPARFQVDNGKWHFHGVFVEIDDVTGKAKRVQAFRTDEDEVIME